MVKPFDMTKNIYKNIVFFILVSIHCLSFAENFPSDLLNEAPKHFRVIVDRDHEAIIKPNSDERIIVLQNTEEEDESKGERTLLIVKKGPSDQIWHVLAKSKKAIPFDTCGGPFGDCFEDLETLKNGFSITLYGGDIDKWSKKFIFAYSRRDKTWELISAYEAGFRLEENKTIFSYRKTYTPQRDFGLIKIEDFDPDDYLGMGNK